MMNTTSARCVLMALLLQAAATPVPVGAESPKAAPAAPASQPVTRGGELSALEKKLLGSWKGPACGGDYTFNPDGTYVCTNFTPGGNTLTGTWSIRWDALPPTLILTCKTSDFKKRAPNWPEYEYLGKAVEVKLLELKDGTLIYQSPNSQWQWRGYRPKKD